MDGTEEVAGLREELAQQRGSRRYPAELVARVLSHLSKRRRAGAKVEEVAGELGVLRQSLHRWERERRQVGLTLRPVVMARAVPMVGGVVATYPSGQPRRALPGEGA